MTSQSPYPLDSNKSVTGLRPPLKNACKQENPFYQSSSSSLLVPVIALCLALNASASPPAKLPEPMLLGVALPDSVPLLGRSESVPRLTALSLAGVGGGNGFLALAAGLFTGGAGGVGLARTAGAGDGFRSVPFVSGVAAKADVARAGAVGGGGGGGGARACCSISSTYAEGAQPWDPVIGFLQSHHPEKRVSVSLRELLDYNLPLPSFCKISRMSPADISSSLELGELKSYLTLACGLSGTLAGGAAGGGGGGGARFEDTEDAD